MSKKLYICRDDACKKADPDKKLKKFAKKMVGKNKIKKCGCLGICKKAFAVKYTGETYSCPTKTDLEKILT